MNSLTEIKSAFILKKLCFLTLITALMFLLIGCEKKKESKYDEIDKPEIQKDFQNFIENRRMLIKEIIVKNGINPSTAQNGAYGGHKDWLQYRVTTLKHKKTRKISSSAWVWIWGTSKFLGDIELPESIMLMFDRKDNKWVLLLEDGYLSEPRFEGEDKSGNLSPEVHAALKSIFPYHFDFSRLENSS